MARVTGKPGYFRSVIKMKVKMKKKGKVKLPKGIKPKKVSKNALRVFGASTDLSQDTASKQKWIKTHLGGLNSNQLRRLKRKISKIATCLQEHPDIGDEVLAHKEVIFEYVEHQFAQTEKNLEDIRKLVKKRTEEFPEQTQKHLTLNFVRDNYADIIQDYEKRVKDRLILPEDPEEDATLFIFRTIKRYL